MYWLSKLNKTQHKSNDLKQEHNWNWFPAVSGILPVLNCHRNPIQLQSKTDPGPTTHRIWNRQNHLDCDRIKKSRTETESQPVPTNSSESRSEIPSKKRRRLASMAWLQEIEKPMPPTDRSRRRRRSEPDAAFQVFIVERSNLDRRRWSRCRLREIWNPRIWWFLHERERERVC